MDPLVVVRLSAIRRPSSRFTFIDEEEASMASGAFFVPVDQTDFWWMLPGCRDKGCGLVRSRSMVLDQVLSVHGNPGRLAGGT
jgi:hypothetical protein